MFCVFTNIIINRCPVKVKMNSVTVFLTLDCLRLFSIRSETFNNSLLVVYVISLLFRNFLGISGQHYYESLYSQIELYWNPCFNLITFCITTICCEIQGNFDCIIDETYFYWNSLHWFVRYNQYINTLYCYYILRWSRREM